MRVDKEAERKRLEKEKANDGKETTHLEYMEELVRLYKESLTRADKEIKKKDGRSGRREWKRDKVL